MKARGNRDELVHADQGRPSHHGHHQERLDPASIRADVDTSLKRLCTDRLDIWLLHKD